MRGKQFQPEKLQHIKCQTCHLNLNSLTITTQNGFHLFVYWYVCWLDDGLRIFFMFCSLTELRIDSLEGHQQSEHNAWGSLGGRSVSCHWACDQALRWSLGTRGGTGAEISPSPQLQAPVSPQRPTENLLAGYLRLTSRHCGFSSAPYCFIRAGPFHKVPTSPVAQDRRSWPMSCSETGRSMGWIKWKNRSTTSCCPSPIKKNQTACPSSIMGSYNLKARGRWRCVLGWNGI